MGEDDVSATRRIVPTSPESGLLPHVGDVNDRLGADGCWPADWRGGFPPNDWYPAGSDRDDADQADAFWDAVHGGDGGSPPEPQWALDASARVERVLLADAASGGPGGWSAQILERRCPDGRDNVPCGLDAAGLLDGITGLQRLINWAQAAQQRYTAALARPGVAAPLDQAVELAGCPLGLARDIPDVPVASLLDDPTWAPAIRNAAIKLAAAEVGCALGVAPVTARARTERAVVMVDELPGTLAAQQAGDLDGYRASIIAERTSVLSADQRRIAERRVLPTAGLRTPGRLRELVDRQVTRIDPEAAAERERCARRRRGVHVQPGLDGMAGVHADVAAPDAQISYGVLDRIARTIQAAGLARGRGRSQIRADVFTDIFHTLAATGRVAIGQPGRPTDRSEAPGTGTPTDGARHIEDGPSNVTAPAENPPVATGADNAEVASTGARNQTDNHPADEDPVNDGPGAADPDTAAGPDTDVAAAVGAATWQAAADSAARTIGPGCPDEPAGPARSGWVLPVCVNVYVNASTLAGWDDQPGELDGHGIISAEFARALAASAGTIRAIATTPVSAPASHPPGGTARAASQDRRDDTGGPPGSAWTGGHSTNSARARVCGTALDAGRAVYRAPKVTADYVTARDRSCTFTGCRARADRCDLDHRLPWDKGGATCPCNQDPLCRFHHALKTFTGWRASPGPDGSLIWTSPAGRCYPTEPAHVLLDDSPNHPHDPGNLHGNPHDDPDDHQHDGKVDHNIDHNVDHNADDDPPPF